HRRHVLSPAVTPSRRSRRRHRRRARALDAQPRRRDRAAAGDPAHAGCGAAHRGHRAARQRGAEHVARLSQSARADTAAARQARRRPRGAVVRALAAAAAGAGADVAAGTADRAAVPAARHARAMTVDAFIAERRARWAELENAVKHARRGRLRSLPASELERFGQLLRRASSDLAIAPREFPDAAITEYLN